MVNVNSLSSVDVGLGKTFLINRTSGRWAVVAHEAMRLLHSTETADAEPRRALLEQLAAKGVFNAPYSPPANLNTLILKVTKKCNYGCKYCYDLEADDAWIDIKLETAMAAIDEALRLAHAPNTGLVHPDLGVILHGGEPTLRFDLIKQIVIEGRRLAKEYGKTVSFSVQSNLSLLNDDMVQFSYENDLAWGVSMDGPPEINDKFRVLHSGRGTYSYFDRALEKYPDFVRKCGVMTTVTSATEDHLLQIARHFRDCGLSVWKWSLFQSLGVARKNGGATFQYSAEKVNAAWDPLCDAVEAGEFDGFEVGPVLDYLTNLITGPGPDMCKRNGCGAARDLLSVSSDGTIEACDCLDRKGPLGKLGLIQIQRKDSLQQALASETAATIRSRDVARGQCGQCSWLAVCGGTCLAHARAVHGISDEMCGVSMHIYTRLARSMAHSQGLRRYWDSIRAAREPWERERLSALEAARVQ